MIERLQKNPTIRLLGLVFAWVFVQWADPLGLDTAARGALNAFVAAISGPFHDISSDPAGGEIAVVELTLEGGSWPVPLARHVEILTRILRERPKAMFVDIRFLEREPGQPLDAFDDLLRIADEQHTTVLFARGRAEWAELPEPLTSRATLNAWEGGPQSYRLLIGAHGHAAHSQPTAAFDLYRRLCAARNWPGRCVGPLDDAQFASTMVVHWGSMPNDKQSQLSEGCRVSEHVTDRLWLAVKFGAASLFHVTQGMAVQPCRPFLTIQADKLDNGLIGNPALSAASLLGGRVVFYGAAIQGDHDTIVAPVLGMMPGVQFHAAAFDNLLAFGSRYFHEPSIAAEVSVKGHEIEVTWLEVIQLLIWVAVLSPVGRVMLDRLPRQRNWRRDLGWVLLAVATSVYLIDRQSSEWPPDASRMFACLYLGLFALSVASLFSAMRDGKSHALIFVLMGAWLLLFNETLLRLSAPDWLGFVILYVGIVEAMEAEEKKRVAAETNELSVQRP